MESLVLKLASSIFWPVGFIFSFTMTLAIDRPIIGLQELKTQPNKFCSTYFFPPTNNYLKKTLSIQFRNIFLMAYKGKPVDTWLIFSSSQWYCQEDYVLMYVILHLRHNKHSLSYFHVRC